MIGQIFKFLFISLFGLFFSVSAFTQSGHQEFIVRNGQLHVKNPVGPNGKAASMIGSYRTSENGETNLFFVGGEPADNMTRREHSRAPEEKRPTAVVQQIGDLQFLVDANKQRIAAFYVLKPLKTLRVGSAHALLNGEFEIPSEEKVFGLFNHDDNTILDLAIRTYVPSIDLLEAALANLIDPTDNITSGYVDHLNVLLKPAIDAKEFVLSNSTVNIVSQNLDYVFFRNDQNAMVGAASSGSIIYNDKNHKPHSIVVCTTQIKINETQTIPVVRAIKLNAIKRYQLIELNRPALKYLKKLDCENHDDSRRGGG